MSKYQVPSWAASAPTPGFYLEILKEGTIIGTIDLDNTHFVFGRQHDIVDIPLDHPSISRQHAALQFRVDDGALMILDLGSAQGTYVNKNKLDPSTFKRVYVGDILKFGSSTRSYIVNGPEDHQPQEYDSENLQAYRKKLQLRTAKAMQEKLEAAAAGVSWGFREDAENDDEEDDQDDAKGSELPDYIRNDENFHRKHGKKFSADIDESTVDEKDRAILEKIRTKERKIQNMQEENRRIYVKEASQADGLTEGQIAAVNRNDENMERLKDDIAILVEQLKTKKAHRDGFSADDRSGPKPPNESVTRGADDEENDWDTTDQTADVSTNWRLRKKLAKKSDYLSDIRGHSNSDNNNEPLTYEELKEQRDRQLELVTSIQKRLAETVAIATGGITSGGGLSSSGALSSNKSEDDLDDLVSSTRAKEAASSVKQLKVEETNAIAKLKSIEKLLKIATPALSSLVGAPNKNNPTSQSQSISPTSPMTPGTHATKALGASSSGTAGGSPSTAVIGGSAFPVPSILPAEVEEDGKSAANPEGKSSTSNGASSPGSAAKDSHREGRHGSFDKKEHEKASGPQGPGHNHRKRNKSDDAVQMQSLASFMKFAEEEKQREEASPASPGAGNERKKVRVAGPSRGDDISTIVPAAGSSSDRQGDGSSNDNAAAAAAGKTKKVLGPSKPAGIAGGKGALVAGGAMLEGGEKAWVPPKNQAGDGRTALNDKLGY
jgi:hypothetical protein